MSVRHPMQDQRKLVKEGQHAGRKGKVICVRSDLTNSAGDFFVEIEFDSQPGSRKTQVERDLVPSRYLDGTGDTNA